MPPPDRKLPPLNALDDDPPPQQRRVPKPKPQRAKAAKPTGRGLAPLFNLIGWSLAIAIAVGAVGLAVVARDLPNVDGELKFVRRPAITVEARDGTVLARSGDLFGDMVTVEDMPPHLINAVLAIEDRRFYSHWGIDPIGLARAVVSNIRAGEMRQGGSTITQQLAKLLFLSSDRTLTRKMQEAVLALTLEARFSKEQILTAYLNRVYLGAGNYGFDAAARSYFNRPAREVTVAQAAMLAGLLKAPSRYSPSVNAGLARTRAATVLSAMGTHGFLADDELAAARVALDQAPTPGRKPGSGDGAQYAATQVITEIEALIGKPDRDLIVRTTLDARIQASAERQLDAALDRQGAALGVTQGAVVVMTPDGAIRALVGGRDFSQSQFNRATQARRQPGSAFKPVVYLAALEAGIGLSQMMDDEPIDLRGWRPGNFDGTFRGRISLRDALVLSVNTIAVRLMQQVGPQPVIATARRLGINSPLEADLSLALGSSAITPLELATAYATLAAAGRPAIPHLIARITDRSGAELYSRMGEGLGSVADPVVLGQLAGALREVIERGTGTAAALDRPAAGKTGTSSDFRDAWFAGFTADLAAVVWLGNDDNSAMKRVTGGGLPAGIWAATMRDAHRGLAPRPLMAEAMMMAAARPPEPEQAPSLEDAVIDEVGGLLGRLIDQIFN